VSDEQPAAPVLRLVRGGAEPAEIAALVAVLSAVCGPGEDVPSAPASRWGAPARALRTPLSPGPDAWRASGWAR